MSRALAWFDVWDLSADVDLGTYSIFFQLKLTVTDTGNTYFSAVWYIAPREHHRAVKVMYIVFLLIILRCGRFILRHY